MKQEWKPDEMRASAEEIRGAIMPKSVTPEMVGGTLLGLVNAVGEVVEVLGEIPMCHVKVYVEPWDGTNLASAEGAIVFVDTFAIGGIPTLSYPRKEYIAGADGTVEFDVPIGCKFAVFSKLDGFGASAQLVYEATHEPREVWLQQFPVGVWSVFAACVARDDDEDYYETRFFTFSHVVTDWESEEVSAKLNDGEYCDDGAFMGIIVSTEETSFEMVDGGLSEGGMAWCENKDFRNEFITLPGKWYDYDNGEEFSAAQNRAMTDYDGNLNTSKILGHAPDAPAARWCANLDPWRQVFLPSAGQLAIMQLNNVAINALMSEANEEWGAEYKLLPYKNSSNKWQYPNKTESGNGRYEYWWSSTRSTFGCSWVVYYYGYLFNLIRYYAYDVRAVSAFHFEY